jgi:hypothetical protein
MYTFNNPSGPGLVDDAFPYPFTGSIGYDFRDVIDSVAW